MLASAATRSSARRSIPRSSLFPAALRCASVWSATCLSLSGVSAVIWLEGINDFGRNTGASVDAVEAGMKEVVGRIRARLPGVKIIGATLTSALGSANAAHGSPAEDEKRQQLNEFIRTSRLFDGVADFDRATLDPASRRPPARIRPRQHHRRTRRQTPPQSRRLSGHGGGDRSGDVAVAVSSQRAARRSE